MTPFYLCSGNHMLAAIYEPASGAPKDISVLLVPPFGWDDQTAYRPRRDWSLALAKEGFANLRIDFPGCGDSSGTPREEGLVEAWTEAVETGVRWLRRAGASRVAVIALGAGGLVSLHAIARGAKVDDLVLWGMPASGRSFIREFKAFSRFEQSQTGEPASDRAEGELCAGGHVLAPHTIASLGLLDATALFGTACSTRTLLLGRDGTGPEASLLEAFNRAGSAVRSDPGHGWGVALARAQSPSPFEIFKMVNDWLLEAAKEGVHLSLPATGSAQLGAPGRRIRETPILFEGAGQELYAILAEPIDAPVRQGSVILFNAGAIRRIGPNRMWTEAARRWAAAGIPVLRVDIEGIGDAGGDGTKYEADESFYTQALLDQARSALELAESRGLPDAFLLGGLCSGGFWGFQLALEDPRVKGVMALNPRMLIFDSDVEGWRELRRLLRLFTAKGLRSFFLKKGKWLRFQRLLVFVATGPRAKLMKRRRKGGDALAEAMITMHHRGQSMDLGFSGDEPLYDELRKEGRLDVLKEAGVKFHELPYMSHTLKPLRAQKAAHLMLDEVVQRTFSGA